MVLFITVFDQIVGGERRVGYVISGESGMYGKGMSEQ
jgi:hypothetical protein